MAAVSFAGGIWLPYSSLAAYGRRMDHFFLPQKLRTPERLAEPGGNVDYGRFLREVVPGLQAGSGFQYQEFNCKTMVLEEMIAVPQNALTIVEGSYSMHPRFGNLYDAKAL